MSRILAIGIATLDIINTVEAYPEEDQEIRALAQRVSRGGNAANLLVVLSQLGHTCSWGGLLADEPDANRILEDLERYGIQWLGGRRVSGGKVPTSYVILNRQNGSRTIVHYRDLPEFSYQDFRKIDLSPFEWLHFEGRNIVELRRMLELTRSAYPHRPCSMEIEKPRPGIEALFSMADLLLFSKTYAQHRGYQDAVSFLQGISHKLEGQQLVCAWGSAGAWAMDRNKQLFFSPSFPPPRELDTLGAGDVFNAALIHGLLNGNDLGQSITAGCRLAGSKCGQAGFEGLARYVSHA